METVDLSLTYAGGKDKSLTDEFAPGRGQFGLLDADTQAVTIGANLAPVQPWLSV